MSASDKLTPGDTRVKYETAQIRGKTYSYMLGEPEGQPKDTIVLVHGFPDIGFGWRCQIPYLISLGLRVVVPDMLGYGGTDAPAELEPYSLKSLSDDVAELARKFVGEDGQIILGGHDWGGAVVWRLPLWHPKLIKGVFSVCTPFGAPRSEYHDLKDVVALGILTNFKYQLQFRGPETEANIQGEEKLRQFFTCMFGGRNSNGEPGFDVSQGILFDKLESLKPSPLLSKEELEYYVKKYASHPAPELHGPLNWYRTAKLNFEEEKPLSEKPTVLELPSLLVTAERDSALPPEMARNMPKHFKDLTTKSVNASHWALTQAGPQVNEYIGDWIKASVWGEAPPTKSAL
ncbi:unnamed protein product [Clonostachys rosea]|uniref:AB hydrolase-1 domain-containing protein n=1 Tax=Bionectria ochroleuca TaxID=29856 RepID=A0ABY6U5R3_BIOOC|nr:unnamed protein product [Clonostachys rosea]